MMIRMPKINFLVFIIYLGIVNGCVEMSLLTMRRSIKYR